MNRTTTRRALALLAAALGLALAAPGGADDLPTAEEVFARHHEAIGGDAVSKVKNAAFEFTFSMLDMGLTTTGKAWLEPPTRAYMMLDLTSVAGSNHEEGIADGVAWQNSPQTGLRVLDGMEKNMARQRARLDPFASWKEFWVKAETVAEEPFGEGSCYKVVMTPAEGEPLSGCFDKEKGMLVWMKVPVPQMGSTVLVKPSDYRAVDGVLMAHRIDQEGPMRMTIEYTSIRLNVDDIPEGRLDLPPGVKDLAQ